MVNDLILEESLFLVSPSFKIQKNNYEKSGKFPIISQDKDLICGYTNLSDPKIIDDEYCVFGDHTEILKYVNFRFVQGADGIKIFKFNKNKIFPKYFYFAILSKYFKDSQYKRHFEKLRNVLIPLPSIQIQKHIANQLNSFFKLTSDLSEGLPKEINLRDKQYSYYRDLLLNFKFSTLERERERR